MSIYNMKERDDVFYITKFDDALNPEAIYSLSNGECDCPAGHRPHCRHRDMLKIFQRRKAINTNEFYDFDLKRWSTPIADEPAQAHDLPLLPVQQEAESVVRPSPPSGSAGLGPLAPVKWRKPAPGFRILRRIV